MRSYGKLSIIWTAVFLLYGLTAGAQERGTQNWRARSFAPRAPEALSAFCSDSERAAPGAGLLARTQQVVDSMSCILDAVSGEEVSDSPEMQELPVQALDPKPVSLFQKVSERQLAEALLGADFGQLALDTVRVLDRGYRLEQKGCPVEFGSDKAICYRFSQSAAVQKVKARATASGQLYFRAVFVNERDSKKVAELVVGPDARISASAGLGGATTDVSGHYVLVSFRRF